MKCTKLGHALLASLLLAAACAPGGDDLDGSPDETTEDALTGDRWDTIREARQRELDRFITRNRDGYRAFMYGSFGSLGPPYVMFRLFPEIFPSIWGDATMSRLGLIPAPDPGHKLPLGWGFMPSAAPIPTPAGPFKLNVVSSTCASCHVGKVTAPDGRDTVLVGAPSTTSKNLLALGVTVNAPGFDAETFRRAIAAKPAGWFYDDPALAQQEATERAILGAPGVAEAIVDELRTATNALSARFVGTLSASTYRGDDLGRAFGIPGSNDEFAFIGQFFTPPSATPEQIAALVPPRPSPVDLMSTFRRGRSPANWDSSNHNAAHRGVSPAIFNQGVPATTNVEDGVKAGLFGVDLPSPPYPFDVDLRKARRGRVLYGRYCKSCHESDRLFSAAEVGTDPNRAAALTPTAAAKTREILRQTCTLPPCAAASDDEIFKVTGKYRAVKLDGIWTRAPYLHNGSVPTLAQLLVPSGRPSRFVRGNTRYDTQRVGFDWEHAGPETGTWDTTLPGNGNRGHDTLPYLGKDWSQHPDDLAELLEFMKTL